MKKIMYLFLTCLIFSSCRSRYTVIGSLDMLSDRKIESTPDDKMICAGAGGSKKELKKARAVTIKGAVDSILNHVPGGAYLTNVRIYIVENDYLAVSGDVWGKTSSSAIKNITDQKKPNVQNNR